MKLAWSCSLYHVCLTTFWRLFMSWYVLLHHQNLWSSINWIDVIKVHLKFNILLWHRFYMDDILCIMFIELYFGVCSCFNICSYAIQIYDHLLIGLTLQKLIWNLKSCYDIEAGLIMFFVSCLFNYISAFVHVVIYLAAQEKFIIIYKLDWHYKKFIWNVISCYDIDSTWMMFYVSCLFNYILAFVHVIIYVATAYKFMII